MAIQDQLANLPLASDEVFFNYGGSDIPASTVVSLDLTNYVGDVSGHTVPGAVICPTAGTPQAIGVTMETIKAGSSGRVRTGGIAVATVDAAGTVTAGDPVDSSTTVAGAIKGGGHSAGARTLGFARSGAAASDPVLIFIAPSRNA